MLSWSSPRHSLISLKQLSYLRMAEVRALDQLRKPLMSATDMQLIGIAYALLSIIEKDQKFSVQEIN